MSDEMAEVKKFLIVVRRVISPGSVHPSEVRSYVLECSRDEVPAQFQQLILEWMKEYNYPPGYNHYYPVHAAEIGESIDLDLLVENIKNATDQHREEDEARKEEVRRQELERQRERDLQQLARLREKYPDADVYFDN